MPYLKRNGAANFLSCCPKTIDRLVADGLLTPHIFPRLGKRYHTDDLDALAEKEIRSRNPEDFIRRQSEWKRI
jgi:hypothetical protein